MRAKSNEPTGLSSSNPVRRNRRGVAGNRRSRVAPPRPLEAARQALVEQHLPLAHRVAWRIARHDARDVPADELLAEALLGLTYAASRFDETRQVPFTAYATRVIRHCVGHAVVRWRRKTRFVPLSERTWEGDEAWEARERKPPPDPSGRSSARDHCARLRQALPARLFQVLYWHHVEGLDAHQIGTRLGVSRSRAWQLLLKATALARRRVPEAAGDG